MTPHTTDEPPSAAPEGGLPLLPEGLPEGTCALTLRGDSMLPTLSDGDHLTVRVPPGALAFGDIVLVRHERTLYVHRLVGSPGGRLRTKGDGRAHIDGWKVAPADVIGRVIALHTPDGGSRRLSGPGTRWSALAAGAVSAACGHLYRVAYRLDAALASGRVEYRGDVEALNRAGFAGLARFGLLPARGPAEDGTPGSTARTA